MEDDQKDGTTNMNNTLMQAPRHCLSGQLDVCRLGAFTIEVAI